MLTAIRQWVLKTMMKDQTGVMRTLPKKDLVDFNVAMTAERLARNGIDPNALKNVNQVENAINQIDNAPRNVQEGIRSTKSAKVFDMEGKQIKDPKNIMGGKEINQQTLNEELMKTDNPYSDLVNTPRPKTIKEREAEVLAGMEKNNKEAVQRIKNRKMVEEAIDNASPGFAGDRKYDAQLVADDLAEKRFGKDFYDLDQKQQMDLYDESFQGLSDSRFKNKPDPEDMAQGGRAGFKAGLGKRFLELLKGKPKPKFDVERFREGPIDLKFLENIDKKDLAPFIRSRDTMGPGGYGMYDDFADMPAGLRAAELIKTIKGPRNEINYKAAELFLGKKLKGNESADELIQMLNRQEMRADGGRIGYAEGTPELKLYPRASGREIEQEVGPGIKISERDLNYGITGLLEGDKFFGGAEIDKGKVKIDVVSPEGDTLFKDTIGKKDAVNFILGIGDPKGEKFQIKTDKDFENMQLVLKKSFAEGGRANFANGGRIGLKAGMTKRAFLKLMGTGAAGIAALKSGVLGLGKGAGKQVAKEVVQKSTSTPPAYFFELAEKIKTLGRVTDGPQERIKIHSMPAKDGKSELMLTEDIGTGEMQIKKIGKEGDEMTTEVQTMEYTPGSSQADETTQGIPADTYDEYTEFNSRIIKDEYNDPDIVEGIKVDEIIEEVKDQAPSIKKAGGGIARMLGE
jgi:hypothetical protein